MYFADAAVGIADTGSAAGTVAAGIAAVDIAVCLAVSSVAFAGPSGGTFLATVGDSLVAGICLAALADTGLADTALAAGSYFAADTALVADSCLFVDYSLVDSFSAVLVAGCCPGVD